MKIDIENTTNGQSAGKRLKDLISQDEASTTIPREGSTLYNYIMENPNTMINPISDKVKVLMEAPENTHKPVVYPIAMVNSSKNPDVAKDFIAYLSQDAQKNILAKYGFNVK